MMEARTQPQPLVRKDPTTPDGDCAFHAFWGTWDGVAYHCYDVKQKREDVKTAILAALPTDPLYFQILEGIKALIMENHSAIAIDSQLFQLKERYALHLRLWEARACLAWGKLETLLRQHESFCESMENVLRSHLEAQRRPVGQVDLKMAYAHLLSLPDSPLLEQMNNVPELQAGFLEYETATASQDFDWAQEISQLSGIVEEYAEFIKKPGRWLLPGEIGTLAVLFKKTVEFYPLDTAPPHFLNPGQAEIVMICFNGVNHYHRAAPFHHPLPHRVTYHHQPSKPIELPTLPVSTPRPLCPDFIFNPPIFKHVLDAYCSIRQIHSLVGDAMRCQNGSVLEAEPLMKGWIYFYRSSGKTTTFYFLINRFSPKPEGSDFQRWVFLNESEITPRENASTSTTPPMIQGKKHFLLSEQECHELTFIPLFVPGKEERDTVSKKLFEVIFDAKVREVLENISKEKLMPLEQECFIEEFKELLTNLFKFPDLINIMNLLVERRITLLDRHGTTTLSEVTALEHWISNPTLPEPEKEKEEKGEKEEREERIRVLMKALQSYCQALGTEFREFPEFLRFFKKAVKVLREATKMNPFYLVHLYEGESLITYLLEYRFEKAKQWLREENDMALTPLRLAYLDSQENPLKRDRFISLMQQITRGVDSLPIENLQKAELFESLVVSSFKEEGWNAFHLIAQFPITGNVMEWYREFYNLKDETVWQSLVTKKDALNKTPYDYLLPEGEVLPEGEAVAQYITRDPAPPLRQNASCFREQEKIITEEKTRKLKLNKEIKKWLMEASRTNVGNLTQEKDLRERLQQNCFMRDEVRYHRKQLHKYFAILTNPRKVEQSAPGDFSRLEKCHTEMMSLLKNTLIPFDRLEKEEFHSHGLRRRDIQNKKASAQASQAMRRAFKKRVTTAIQSLGTRVYTILEQLQKFREEYINQIPMGLVSTEPYLTAFNGINASLDELQSALVRYKNILPQPKHILQQGHFKDRWIQVHMQGLQEDYYLTAAMAGKYSGMVGQIRDPGNQTEGAHSVPNPKRQNEGTHSVFYHDWMHFKFGPLEQGLEMANSAERLYPGRQMMAYSFLYPRNSAPHQVLKTSSQNDTKGSSCLIQVSRTAEGIQLNKILKDRPDLLRKIKPSHVAEHVERILCLSDGDAKSENSMGEFHLEEGVIFDEAQWKTHGEQSVRFFLNVVVFDGDYILGPIIKWIHEGPDRRILMTLRSGLFCMEAPMKTNIPLEHRERYLQRSSEDLLLDWLLRMSDYDQQWKLLSKEGIFTRKELGALDLPLQLEPEILPSLIETEQRLRRVYLEHRGKDLTPDELVRRVEPLVWEYYSYLREKYPDPYKAEREVYNQFENFKLIHPMESVLIDENPAYSTKEEKEKAREAFRERCENYFTHRRRLKAEGYQLLHMKGLPTQERLSLPQAVEYYFSTIDFGKVENENKIIELLQKFKEFSDITHLVLRGLPWDYDTFQRRFIQIGGEKNRLRTQEFMGQLKDLTFIDCPQFQERDRMRLKQQYPNIKNIISIHHPIEGMPIITPSQPSPALVVSSTSTALTSFSPKSALPVHQEALRILIATLLQPEEHERSELFVRFLLYPLEKVKTVKESQKINNKRIIEQALYETSVKIFHRIKSALYLYQSWNQLVNSFREGTLSLGKKYFYNDEAIQRVLLPLPLVRRDFVSFLKKLKDDKENNTPPLLDEVARKMLEAVSATPFAIRQLFSSSEEIAIFESYQNEEEGAFSRLYAVWQRDENLQKLYALCQMLIFWNEFQDHYSDLLCVTEETVPQYAIRYHEPLEADSGPKALDCSRKEFLQVLADLSGEALTKAPHRVRGDILRLLSLCEQARKTLLYSEEGLQRYEEYKKTKQEEAILEFCASPQVYGEYIHLLLHHPLLPIGYETLCLYASVRGISLHIWSLKEGAPPEAAPDPLKTPKILQRLGGSATEGKIIHLYYFEENHLFGYHPLHWLPVTLQEQMLSISKGLLLEEALSLLIVAIMKQERTRVIHQLMKEGSSKLFLSKQFEEIFSIFWPQEKTPGVFHSPSLGPISLRVEEQSLLQLLDSLFMSCTEMYSRYQETVATQHRTPFVPRKNSESTLDKALTSLTTYSQEQGYVHLPLFLRKMFMTETLETLRAILKSWAKTIDPFYTDPETGRNLLWFLQLALGGEPYKNNIYRLLTHTYGVNPRSDGFNILPQQVPDYSLVPSRSLVTDISLEEAWLQYAYPLVKNYFTQIFNLLRQRETRVLEHERRKREAGGVGKWILSFNHHYDISSYYENIEFGLLREFLTVLIKSTAHFHHYCRTLYERIEEARSSLRRSPRNSIYRGMVPLLENMLRTILQNPNPHQHFLISMEGSREVDKQISDLQRELTAKDVEIDRARQNATRAEAGLQEAQQRVVKAEAGLNEARERAARAEADLEIQRRVSEIQNRNAEKIIKYQEARNEWLRHGSDPSQMPQPPELEPVPVPVPIENPTRGPSAPQTSAPQDAFFSLAPLPEETRGCFPFFNNG